MQSNSVAGGYTERFVESSDDMKKDKKGGLFRSKEKKSDGLGPKPDDMRGRWWHELVRAQAAIPNLNYAVVRVAEAYGAAYMEGQVLARLVIGTSTPDLRFVTFFVYAFFVQRTSTDLRGKRCGSCTIPIYACTPFMFGTSLGR